MDASHKESYWSAYAAVYDDGVDYVVGRSLRLAIADRLSHERHLGEVIECGCGTGFYTRVVARHAERVTATDISGEMLDLAGYELMSLKNVLFQRANAEKTPFSSLAFDTALMANLLNIVENPIMILREGFRILKYGGLLIVIAYTDYGMDDADKAALGLRYFQKFGMPPPWGLRNFEPEELCGLVKEAGFAVKTVAILGEKPKALYIRSVKNVTVSSIKKLD